MPRRIAALPILIVLALAGGGCGVLGGSSGSNSAFCKEAKSIADQGESFFPTGSTDSADFQKGLDALRKLQQKAPKDLKDDVGVLITGLEYLQAGNLTALTDPAFVTKIEAARRNFEDYNTKTCKITPPTT